VTSRQTMNIRCEARVRTGRVFTCLGVRVADETRRCKRKALKKNTNGKVLCAQHAAMERKKA